MKNPYPPDWETRRKKVYKRDDYTCCNCQRKGGPYGSLELHAHHIVPKSRGGSHAMTNLISACEACHNAIHSKRKLAPTAAGVVANDGPGLFARAAEGLRDLVGKARDVGAKRLTIHGMLLPLTCGIGNIVYYLHGRSRGE